MADRTAAEGESRGDVEQLEARGDALFPRRPVGPLDGARDQAGDVGGDQGGSPFTAGPSAGRKTKSVSFVLTEEVPNDGEDGQDDDDEDEGAKRPVFPKGSSNRARGRRVRTPIAPLRMSTRSSCKQDSREESLKSSLKKVKKTVVSSSDRPLQGFSLLLSDTALSSTSRDARDSAPVDPSSDVFASFDTADLVRSGVAGADSFVADYDAPGRSGAATRGRRPPSTRSAPPVAAAHPDQPSEERQETEPASAGSVVAPQTSGQSSSILRPFSYFFGSGRGQAASTEVANASEAEAVDSPLDDPLDIRPQTSSTPK